MVQTLGADCTDANQHAFLASTTSHQYFAYRQKYIALEICETPLVTWTLLLLTQKHFAFEKNIRLL